MKPYNPLEKENLGKSVAESLLNSESFPLGQIEQFNGAGVYAIYYVGDFKAYAALKQCNTSSDDLNLPIYVGKAVPTGGRKGKIDPELAGKGTSLFKRLSDHRKSIEAAENLNIEDFYCRFLTVDEIWIPLGESLLIQKYRPLWNAVVDGFGNHDPGAGRYKGARPSWDELHPGRFWAKKCAPPKLAQNTILDKIREYWEQSDS
jgi:hypothetical protein